MGAEETRDLRVACGIGAGANSPSVLRAYLLCVRFAGDDDGTGFVPYHLSTLRYFVGLYTR